jgi:hypothetical protein
MLLRRAARPIAVVITALCSGLVLGQTYPERPPRIVTAEAGGGADYTARILAQGLTASLGQQVVVDNRRGGAGIIAIDTAAKAPPDGYTMLVYNNSMWILSLIKKLPYDPVTDFSPVVSIVSMPNVLVVHPSLPVKSARDLVSLAKSRPGDLSYATAGTGSTGHLAAELFKAMASVNMLHIPYKGSASALNDLMGGHVQVMFPNAAAGHAAREGRQVKGAGGHESRSVEALPGAACDSAIGSAGVSIRRHVRLVRPGQDTVRHHCSAQPGCGTDPDQTGRQGKVSDRGRGARRRAPGRSRGHDEVGYREAGPGDQKRGDQGRLRALRNRKRGYSNRLMAAGDE